METERANKTLITVDFQPPYLTNIVSKSYPKDYVNPRFRKFDGKKANAKEHVISFFDDLGIYANDHDLRMMEFSKSLTDWAILGLSTC